MNGVGNQGLLGNASKTKDFRWFKIASSYNPVAEPHLVLIFVCVVGECNYNKEDDAREEGTSRQLVYVSSLKCVAFVLGFDTVWSDDAYVSDNNGR